MTGNQNPEAIIDGFNQKLRTEWKNHRRQAFNTNTKGKAYEETLKDFLEEYFSDIYNINTRAAVIDEDLKVFDYFSSGENEIDVVATFRQAIPGIILKSGDMLWVPWDGVSFVCEVKSEVTKRNLEHDLEKLASLSELGPENYYNRFPQNSGATRLTTGSRPNKETVVTNTSVNHQLRCLVYDEYNTSGETLMDLASEFTDIWDIILLVDEGLILVSPELPFAEGWQDRFFSVEAEGNDDLGTHYPDILVLPDGLVWFILIISVSIPRPQPFDVSSALMQLVQGEYLEDGFKYEGLINAWQRLFD